MALTSDPAPAVDGSAATSAPKPRWRGVNHLALVTDDMDGTVRFYAGVLGMDLVAAVKAGVARHYFFELGDENTVAFFEWPGHETREHAAGARPPGGAQLDHISFNLPDRKALVDLQQRLRDHGCEVTEIVDHRIVQSIYFTDNNGIALEASYWGTDVTGRDADYDDADVFADPDPVPALDELRRFGHVVTTPDTRLV